MKRALLALVMLAMTFGTAGADPDDLSTAVVIAHCPPDLVYSAGDDWTARYADTYSISSLGEVSPTIPTADPTAWYLLAAFCDGEDKAWGGVQFGFENYGAYIFYFASSGPCVEGVLEIPEGDWPGPGTGVALAATTTNWEGNFEALYYFEGYAYGTAATIQIGDYKEGQPISFGDTGGTGIVIEYPVTDPLRIGSMGVLGDGFTPECGAEEPAACCDIDTGACTLLLADECAAAAGEHYPAVDTCDPNPCEDVCCRPDDTCVVETQAQCQSQAGTWYPEYDDCDINPCIPTAVCCANNSCSVIDEASCDALGGNWYEGEDDCVATPCGVCCIEQDCSIRIQTDCGGSWYVDIKTCEGDPGPCDTPVDAQSWGQIKTVYSK